MKESGTVKHKTILNMTFKPHPQRIWNLNFLEKVRWIFMDHGN